MQTSYSEQSAAQPGQLANLSLKKVGSYVAAARVLFGTLVSLDSTNYEQMVKAPALSADVTDLKLFRGIVLKEQTIENKTGGYSDGLLPGVEAKRTISVLEKGEAWVKVLEDVTPADAFFADFQGANAGQCSKTDTADSVAVTNARYKSNSITVDGVKIAILELY